MIARALLAEILNVVERDPELAARVRRALGVALPVATEPPAIYLRIIDYAKRVSMGERSIWSLVAKGLPTIGEGRSRRVDVARADAWLRDRRGAVDDAVERSARASARRAARGASR